MMLPSDRRHALDGLRIALAPTVRAASGVALLSCGLTALDAALGGGVPRGSVLTLEGAVSSGRSSLLASVLAQATACGVAALIELPTSAEGRLDPACLAAAGVDLDRLLFTHARSATDAARAADIILRSGAFVAVAVPIMAMRSQVWTRLGKLAHGNNTLLIASGSEADSELRFTATIRVQTQLRSVGWGGNAGLFATLASTEVNARVLKHKLAAPGAGVTLACEHRINGALPRFGTRARMLERAIEVRRAAQPA